MKRIECLIALVLVIGFATETFADSSIFSQLLPKEIVAQGWEADDELMVAGDEQTLSMIVNGAAPQYMKLGMKQAAFMNYTKGSTYLMLEIILTASDHNSETMFQKYKDNKSIAVENLGAAARLTSELGGTTMLDFHQGKFYIKLSISSKLPSALNLLKNSAKSISDNMANLNL